MIRLFFLVSVLIFVSGCAEEVGRISFEYGNQKEKEFRLESAKDAELWSEIDVEWVGDMDVGYKVSVYDGNKLVKELDCSSFDYSMSTMSTSVVINNNHHEKLNSRMNCSKEFPSLSSAILKVRPYFTSKPKAVSKLDFVIKQ